MQATMAFRLFRLMEVICRRSLADYSDAISTTAVTTIKHVDRYPQS